MFSNIDHSAVGTGDIVAQGFNPGKKMKYRISNAVGMADIIPGNNHSPRRFRNGVKCNGTEWRNAGVGGKPVNASSFFSHDQLLK
jgi:hypothetical protein